jgi:hypothetical protein
MKKLHSHSTPAMERLNGYLAAAQQTFRRSQYDVTLEASFFEIIDSTLTNEEVVGAAYGDFNPIELQRECS